MVYINAMSWVWKTIIFFLLLCSYSAGAYLEGPFVSNIRPGSVVIWWRSQPPIPGKVFLKDRGFRVFSKNRPPFEISIKGLKPASVYNYYVVLSSGKRFPENGFYRFHTAFKGDKPFKFAVIADSRGPFSMIPLREDVLYAIFKDITKRDIQFICFLGDMIYGYASKEDKLREELRSWKDAISHIMHEIPVYTGMGNHDVVMYEKKGPDPYMLDGAIKDGKVITSEEIFADEFVNPENSPEPECPDAPPYKETCYSFDWGNSHFIFINTDYWMATPKMDIIEKSGMFKLYKKGNPPGRIMDKQMRWIESDIKEARAKKAKHIFVFGHQPIFPISDKYMMDYSSKVTDALKKDIKERRKRLWNIFTKYKVDAAFFGHEHNYSRTLIKDTWQIITAGAGAPLYDGPRKDLPWLRDVKVVKKRYHYCIVTVNGNKVSMDVYALKSNMKDFELIDHADL